MEEYYTYMRNLRYTALDGTKVKSEGERTILNFFITHNLNGKSIKIIYEKPAEWMKYFDKNGGHIPKPDFFFPDYDIYLEHWGIDKNGKVPEWFEGDNPSEKYKRGMDAKKKAFAEQTKYHLVETMYWEFKEDDFIQNLRNKMLEALNEKFPFEDFVISPVPYNTLIDKVWAECRSSINKLSFNIVRFINIAKTYRLSHVEIGERLSNESWSPKQKAFTYLALRIYILYEKELQNTNQIDFADMINLAVDRLNQNETLYKDVFNHILIDEYQDISAQRYELISALMGKNTNCKLFCVGDDWQSIMGFAGSDLDFFVNFSDYFDHPVRTDLTVNYRSVKSIVDTGAEIIKHNPAQLEKITVATNQSVSPVKVYVIESRAKKIYSAKMASHCIDKIAEYLQAGYEPADIMILSRITKNKYVNDNLLKYAREKNIQISTETRSFNRIPFMSVHKSKGLQAKVVFIIDFVEGLYGFPNELQNPDIFEPAIKGRKKDKEEEERRLFYVAMTRAKENVIIYTQKGKESKFLDEITDHTILETVYT